MSDPLSLEQAKERLRTASAGCDVLAWVQEHPAEGSLSALLLGVLVGATPGARRALTESVLFLLKLR